MEFEQIEMYTATIILHIYVRIQRCDVGEVRQVPLPAPDFTDPTTKEIPKANAYSELPGEGINALIKRGANFAVCQMSAETIARMIAMAINGDPDHILAEMNANPAPMAGSLHHVLW